MAESESSSPELPKDDPVDINRILDEDKEVLRSTFNQGRTQVFESDDEESKDPQDGEEKDSAGAEA